MAVLDGLRVIVRNFAELGLADSLEVPDFPGDASKTTTHRVAVDGVFYIERDDYKSGAVDKSFRRLTKNQPVGLKHIGLVLFVEEEKAENGKVCEVIVRAEKLTEENKPKAFVHWVCQPRVAECRLYEKLFQHKNPEDPVAVPGGFLSDCNKDSLTVLRNVYVDGSIANSKVYDKFQFERIGYFAVDPDSKPGKLVFNRTVSLKEDSGKL